MESISHKGIEFTLSSSTPNNNFIPLLPQISPYQKISLKNIKKQSHAKQFTSIHPHLLRTQFQSRKTQQKLSSVQKQNPPINNNTQVLYFSNQIRKIPIQKFDKQKQQFIPYKITKIKANEKISAASDNQGNMWLLGMIFPYPINVSQLIKKRVVEGYLGQKGIMIKTKKSFYLVNWDRIDLSKQILKKIQLQKPYSEYLQCWQQIIPFRSDAWFSFSSKKDSSNQTIFHHIFTDSLIIFPLFQQINIGKKIKGISASKTHSLCWTECGKIYSWGQKSIALGYTDFSEQIKQRQIQNLGFQVASAVAGTHYSIALSTQGQLYEWGIKPIWCQKSNSSTDQFIFYPKKLNIKSNVENQKICCLKGYENHFGVITFKQNLYVWGKSIPRKLIEFNGIYKADNDTFDYHSQNSLPPTLNLLIPTLCKCSKIVKIIDFQMRQDYIFIVASDKNSTIKNQLCENFWQKKLKSISNVIQNCKLIRKNNTNSTIIRKIDEIQPNLYKNKFTPILASQIKKNRKQKSSFQLGNLIKIQQQQKIQKYTSQLNTKLICCQDKITKAINERLSKEDYFKNVSNQQKIYKIIMDNGKSTKCFTSGRIQKIPTEHYMQPRNTEIDYTKFQRKIRNKTLQLRHSQCNLFQINHLFQKSQKTKLKSVQNQLQSNINPFDYQKLQYLLKVSRVEEEKRKKQRFYQNIKRKEHLFRTTINSRSPSPKRQIPNLYDLKLTQVLSRKQSLNEDFFHSTIQKIQKSSLTFRKKQSQETAAIKEREQRHVILKQTLFKFMLKCYTVKYFTNSILFGRQIKIKIFVSNLKYNRIEKSVRRLFESTRIRFSVHDLKEFMPKHFLKLVIIFKSFVKKWKNNKRKKLIKLCVQQMIQINTKHKIQIGINQTKINVKNLQKIGN